MTRKERIENVIFLTCEKELNQTMGFMLTKGEVELFTDALIKAGLVFRDEVGIDGKELCKIFMQYMERNGYLKITFKQMNDVLNSNVQDLLTFEKGHHD